MELLKKLNTEYEDNLTAFEVKSEEAINKVNAQLKAVQTGREEANHEAEARLKAVEAALEEVKNKLLEEEDAHANAANKIQEQHAEELEKAQLEAEQSRLMEIHVLESTNRKLEQYAASNAAENYAFRQQLEERLQGLRSTEQRRIQEFENSLAKETLAGIESNTENLKAKQNETIQKYEAELEQALEEKRVAEEGRAVAETAAARQIEQTVQSAEARIQDHRKLVEASNAAEKSAYRLHFLQESAEVQALREKLGSFEAEHQENVTLTQAQIEAIEAEKKAQVTELEVQMSSLTQENRRLKNILTPDDGEEMFHATPMAAAASAAERYAFVQSVPRSQYLRVLRELFDLRKKVGQP